MLLNQYLCVSNVKNNWFWKSWTCQLGPKNINMMILWGIWKVKVETQWHSMALRHMHSMKIFARPFGVGWRVEGGRREAGMEQKSGCGVCRGLDVHVHPKF